MWQFSGTVKSMTCDGGQAYIVFSSENVINFNGKTYIVAHEVQDYDGKLTDENSPALRCVTMPLRTNNSTFIQLLSYCDNKKLLIEYKDETILKITKQ